MKLVLLVNKNATAYASHLPAMLTKAFREHEVDVQYTTGRGNATDLAANAAADGAEVVVVLGGDGTLNEAANGLVGTNCALAGLPGGSTNVFIRTIGFSNDILDAAEELRDAISEDRKQRVGLGVANGRHFLCHTGVGFDASVVKQVEERAALRRRFGSQLFAWRALFTWSEYANRRKPRFTVEYLDQPSRRIISGYLTICLNTDPYTFFRDRPLTIAPGFGLDHSLAVMTVKSVTRPSFPLMIASALVGGSYLRRHPHTSFRAGVRELQIYGPDSFGYQLDGEYEGHTRKLHISYAPDVLNIYLGTHPVAHRRRFWQPRWLRNRPQSP